MCDGAVNITGNPAPASRMRNAASRAGDLFSIDSSYDSPMEMKSSYDSSSNSLSISLTSGGVMSFRGSDGSATADRSGASRKDFSLAQYLNEDMMPCTTGNASFAKVVQPDGSSQTLNLSTGSVHSMTTKTGAVISKQSYDSQVQVSKNSQGDINSITSSRDGMLSFSRSSNNLTISQYGVSQVSRHARGEAVPQGDPVKIYSYEWNPVKGAMIITSQEAGLQVFTRERRVEGNKTIITEGSEDERVVTTYERNMLSGEKWEEIKTVQKFGAADPSLCERVVKKYTDGGWLVLSRTEGYGTMLARTTSYTYNDQFRVSVKALPGGGYTRYEYDSQGRVIMEASPWTDGDYEKVVHTVYADQRFNDFRPSMEQVTLMNLVTGEEQELKRSIFTYDDSTTVQRKVVTTWITGETSPVTTITETWGESAANEYSRGRVKMEQDASGVQKCTSYEDTSLHGAKWKVTEETRVNDAVVPGQSEKTIRYLAEDETVAREEKYVHTGQGWSLISSEDYQYDALKRLIKTTRGNGRVSTAEWGCCGPLRQVDEDGVMLSYAYNTSRQLVEIIRSATDTKPESIISYTRDSSGNILHLREDVGSMQRTHSRTYDILGRVTSETDYTGRVTTWLYAQYGLKEMVVYPSGAQATLIKNKDGSTHSYAAVGRRTIVYHYEPSSQGVKVTRKLEDGRVLGYDELDGDGKLLNTCESPVNTMLSDQLVLSNLYNGKSQLVSSTDRGVLTQYQYDAIGNRSRQVLPMAPSPTPQNSRVIDYANLYEEREDGVYRVMTETSYNEAGLPLVRSRAELVSQLSSTLESKVVSTDVLGNVTTEWTEYGAPTVRVRKVSLPASNITAETCLTDGFVVSSTDQAGVSTTQSRSYTSTGYTVTVTDARGNVSSVKYDLMERPVLKTDAAGATESYSYDPATGRLSEHTNALQRLAKYIYDENARVVAAFGDGIPPVCFSYDEDGNLAIMKTFRVPGTVITQDPRTRTDGDVTIWEYAWQARLLTKTTYADGHSVSLQYGEMNRLASSTDSAGRTLSRSYDAATGELIDVSCDDGVTPAIHYGYNRLGWLTSVQDAAGTRTFTYDAHGLPETEVLSIGGLSHVLQNKMDGLGRLEGLLLKQGASSILDTSFSYDAVGRYASGAIAVQGVSKQFSFGYMEGTNLLQTLTMPQGVTQQITYDEHRDLETGYLFQNSTGVPLLLASQSYDIMRRVASDSWQRSGDSPIQGSFVYNARNEMETVTWHGNSYAYAYDNIGNRTAAREASTAFTYQSNALNQYTRIQEGTAAPFVPACNLDGCQTLVKTSTGIWSVEYNAEKRPIRFSNTASGIVVECAYDYRGRRCMKKVTKNGSVTVLDHYLYLGYLQVACIDARNGASLRHGVLWDLSRGMASRPLGLLKGGALYTYAWDRNKNIRAVLDSSSRLVAGYDYSPYGAVTATGTLENPFQWSSEFYDAELGLVYYNFRYYSPLDGRWLSRDPLGEVAGLNLYVFARNTQAIDVLGLAAQQPCDPKSGMAGMIGGLTGELLKKWCIKLCHGNEWLGSGLYGLFPMDKLQISDVFTLSELLDHSFFQPDSNAIPDSLTGMLTASFTVTTPELAAGKGGSFTVSTSYPFPEGKDPVSFSGGTVSDPGNKFGGSAKIGGEISAPIGTNMSIYANAGATVNTRSKQVGVEAALGFRSTF